MGFLDTIGLVATGLNSANAEVERLRKLDQEQADLALERAQRFIAAGNYEGGVKAASPAAKLYGLNMPDFKNGTITEQVAAPGVGNATPPGQLPTPGTPTPRFGLNPSFGAASLPDLPKMETIGLTRDSGAVDWSDAGNQEKARRFAAMPPDKLGERNPEHDVYNTRTGAVVSKGTPSPSKVTAEDLMAWRNRSLDVKEKEGEKNRKSREGIAAEGRKTRLQVLKETIGAQAFMSGAKNETQYDQHRAKFVQREVENAAKANTIQKPVLDAAGRPISGMFTTERVPLTAEQKKEAQRDAEDWYDDNVERPRAGGKGGARPFDSSRRGAVPAAGGVMNVAPPTKFEDVALLPNWEGRAQAVLKLVPGVAISSRARSADRNAKAKPGGGAPNSWHMHRQAFDVVNYTAEQKAKLRAWAASEGIHMRDEGNHLHFEPLRTSAADSPALAAFYERHGIAPGDDHHA